MILAPAETIAAYRAGRGWGSETVYDVFRANVARYPGDEAVVDPPNRAEFTDGEPQRLNWSALAEKVDRLAAVLTEAGVGRDDFVCIQLPTTHEILVAYMAVLRVGAIATPVAMQYRAHELTYILRHCRACAFVTCARIGRWPHAEMALALREAVPSLRHVLAFGAAVPPGAIALDAALASPKDTAVAEPAAVTADDIAILLWTSGSEAEPKPVPRSHNNILANRAMMSEAADLGHDSRILAPRLMNTTGGITGAMLPWLDRGATLVLHQPFRLDVFLAQIRDEAIDFTSCPPGVLHDLLGRDDLRREIDFPRLRYISSGSAALAESVLRGFADRFGVEVMNFYGSSEGASLAAIAKDIPDPAKRARFFPRYGDRRFTWHATPARHMETKLVDPASGERIETPGVVGEICFRGPNVFPGYFEAPELTARAVDAEGFYHSGDLFEIAGKDGEYYRFVGRAKDIIVRGGMNISAEELDTLLGDHPGIREVAVVGYPDDKLGEKVCAAVVPKDGREVTLVEIAAFLRNEKQVAVFKLPQRIVTVEALPRTASGKIARARLRALVGTLPESA
ncbi:MAG TPA: class I adenylate-forming enzyme family protein [Hyphomicrobiales bacterium]|nr:class I adenylate-forming enzyme family protein [Hyphomicrobiales bacterium]